MADQDQNEVNLWDLADLRTPWCLRVAATLRVAEHIAGGIREVDALAAAAQCDAGVLERVLGHLVSRGVFTLDGAGQFGLNDRGAATAGPDDAAVAGPGRAGRAFRRGVGHAAGIYTHREARLRASLRAAILGRFGSAPGDGGAV